MTVAGLTVDPSGVGVVSLCVALVVAYSRGWIVTRREADDIRHDRDEWRAAHRISETARQEEREQSKAMAAEFGATLTGFLQGFRQATDRAVGEVDQS